MAERHPLAEKLARLYRQRKSMSADELERLLFDVQDEIEDHWERGEFQKLMSPEDAQRRTCARDGCNNSRYAAPNAKFCILHSQGNDSFAANYRRARAREHATRQ
jgi:hypothetical protein